MDQTIRVGAPSADLWITIGATAYKVLLHDNGDGTYVLRFQTAGGVNTDLAASVDELNALAAGGMEPSEFAFINNCVAGTAAASKCLVMGATKNIDTLLFDAATVTAKGSTQGTGQAMTADTNIVDSADNTKCVVLPVPVAGRRVIVVNTVADKTLPVFPSSGAAINALGANAAITLPAATLAAFYASSATQWYALVVPHGITATAAELNKLAGTSANVTQANLDTLTGGGDVSTLHTHAAAYAPVGAYVKPAGGIPETDLETAVSTSLGLADSAYQKPGGGIPATDMTASVQAALASGFIRYGKVTLNGIDPTAVVFQDDGAAFILGTDDGATKALANADTLIVNPDGNGDDTVTFAAAAGTSVSAGSPATDMSPTPGYSLSGTGIPTDPSAETAGTSVSGASPATDLSSTAGTSTSAASPPTNMVGNEDTKFNINVDGAGANMATCDWTGCNTGALVAAQLQIAARAASTTNVTCTYTGGVYVFTSDTVGASSSVVITTSADASNVADDLGIGVAFGGTEVGGTASDTKLKIAVDGDATPQEITCDFSAANSGTLIAAELQTQIQAEGGDYASVTCAYADGLYTITSASTGSSSSVVITDGATSNVADSLKLGVGNGGTETTGTQYGTKFKISADGDAAEEVTCNWAGCNTLTLAAAQMESVIQALGGNKASVTVAESPAGQLKISSSSKAAASAILITDGDTSDVATALKLGASNGGTEAGRTVADHTLKIAVDGNAAREIDMVDWLTGTTGSDIASWMQTKIQAVGSECASVTVGYGAGVYTITSGTAGTASAVVVTAATSSDCADSLKLGAANSGVETAGTGDAANIAAATAAEVAAAIDAKATGWSAEAVGNKVRIYSDSEGDGSSLVVNAASTADTILGITGSAYGPEGLGYDTDMSNANYIVTATLDGVAQANIAAKGLSITDKTTAGFNIHCETTSATHDIALIIAGVPA